MIAGMVVFAFLIAAGVVLLDQGTLWHFTLDPARRLTMVVYLVTHAVMIAVIVNYWNALKPKMSPLQAALSATRYYLLRHAILGLLAADVVVLMQAIFAEHAIYAIAIVFAASLIPRQLPKALLTNSPKSGRKELREMTWCGVIKAMPWVAVFIAIYFASLIVLLIASSFAFLILDYAVLENEPSVLAWWIWISNFVFQDGVLWLFIALCSFTIIAVVLLKALVSYTRQYANPE